MPPPDQAGPAVVPQPRRLGVVLRPERLRQRDLHASDRVAGGERVQPPLEPRGLGEVLGLDSAGELIRRVFGELGVFVAGGEVGLPVLPGGGDVEVVGGGVAARGRSRRRRCRRGGSNCGGGHRPRLIDVASASLRAAAAADFAGAAAAAAERIVAVVGGAGGGAQTSEMRRRRGANFHCRRRKRERRGALSPQHRSSTPGHPQRQRHRLGRVGMRRSIRA